MVCTEELHLIILFYHISVQSIFDTGKISFTNYNPWECWCVAQCTCAISRHRCSSKFDKWSCTSVLIATPVLGVHWSLNALLSFATIVPVTGAYCAMVHYASSRMFLFVTQKRRTTRRSWNIKELKHCEHLHFDLTFWFWYGNSFDCMLAINFLLLTGVVQCILDSGQSCAGCMFYMFHS